MSVLAFKPQKDILDSLNCKYAWFRCNRLHTTSNLTIDCASSTDLNGELTLSGTGADADWTGNPTWYEPAASTQDVFYGIATAASNSESTDTIYEICRLDDIEASNGILMINFWVDLNTAAAVTDSLVSYSGGDTGDQTPLETGNNSFGGWLVYCNNNIFHFLVTLMDGSNATDVDIYTQAVSTGEHMLTMVVDGSAANPTATWYLDGQLEGGGNSSKTLATGDLPRGDTERGFRLFGKDNSLGETETATQIWGSNASSPLSGVSDILIMRFDSDVSSNIAGWIGDLYAMKRGNLPRSFEGI